MQSVLLFALAAPTYILMLASLVQPELSVADYLFFGTQVVLIASEWFSDQQQWGMSKMVLQERQLPAALN